MADAWAWATGSLMKVCFVTTGATAPFKGLIESILQPSALDALHNAGYTHLLIQYGTAKDVFDNSINAAHLKSQNLIIGGFDFNPDGLETQFKLVQDSQGVIISHAGSGTILAALRYGIALVVVPNTQLLDNHQAELAIAMEKSGYLIQGDVNDLVPAIRRSEEFRTKMAQFPPITSGKHRETKSFAAIMDETMGFLD